MSTRDTPWPTGTPCWVDLMTADAAASRQFYAELFGWRVEIGGPETGHYAMCLVNDRPAAGIGGVPDGQSMPTVWTTYLAVDDLDAALERVTEHGGRVAMPALDVLTEGRMAVVVDPTGAAVGLWEAGDHTGAQVVNEPGSVTWNEVLTRDYEGAKAFYAAVFGLGLDPVEGPPEFQYSALTLDGRTVGGLGQMDAAVPAEVPAHWMTYFAVADTDVAVADVKRLGGSVQHGPFDSPYGRMAVVSDPQGGAFALMQTSGEGSP